jgi:hypothetical protein
MLARLTMLVLVLAGDGCTRPVASRSDASAADAGSSVVGDAGREAASLYRGPCGADVLACPTGRECCIQGFSYEPEDEQILCCPTSAPNCCVGFEKAGCYDGCPSWCPQDPSVGCPHGQWCDYGPASPQYGTGDCLAQPYPYETINCVSDCPAERRCGQTGCCESGTYCDPGFQCCKLLPTDGGIDAPLDGGAAADAPRD